MVKQAQSKSDYWITIKIPRATYKAVEKRLSKSDSLYPTIPAYTNQAIIDKLARDEK